MRVRRAKFEIAARIVGPFSGVRAFTIEFAPISFEVVAECSQTRARAGLLHTPHGAIDTPVFMPVGTEATVKGLTQRDLGEELGVRILLANTILYAR